MKFKTMMIVLACLFAMSATAKKYPVIKFEKTTIDFGTFSQDNPVQTCVFKFTNVGKAKLAITYVHTSCGCTVADYPKDFISPGGTGEIKVTYDGTGKQKDRDRICDRIHDTGICILRDLHRPHGHQGRA